MSSSSSPPPAAAAAAGKRRPRAPTTPNTRRIIIHFDLDAFYVACERELNPELQNIPVAVSQYNPHGNLDDLDASSPNRIVAGPLCNSYNNNNNNNGSLIAVSYEARAKGVKRNDRGQEAVQKCADLVIVQVPVRRGKADLSIYRNASARVVSALKEAIQRAVDIYIESSSAAKCGILGSASSIVVEKASIDEIYVDVTAAVHTIVNNFTNENVLDYIQQSLAHNVTTIGGVETATSVSIATNALTKNEIRRGSSLQVLDSSSSASGTDVGSKAWWSTLFASGGMNNNGRCSEVEVMLACGAAMACDARASVFNSLGFTLSAGVSCNKTLAKLASGLKKPNRQTLINPHDSNVLKKLFHPLRLDRMRGLGGKWGEEVCEILQISTVGELAKVPLFVLKHQFLEQADFLYSIAQGECSEEVSDRLVNKSIVCGKTFRGANAMPVLDTMGRLRKWIHELCGELTERLDHDQEENSRFAKTLTVSMALQISDEKRSVSRSCKCPQKSNLMDEAALKLCHQIINDCVPKALLGGSAIVNIYVKASNFVVIATGASSIMAAFGKQAKLSQSMVAGTKAKKDLWSKRTNGKLSSSLTLKAHPILAAFGKQKKSSESLGSREENISKQDKMSMLKIRQCEKRQVATNSPVPGAKRWLKQKTSVQSNTKRAHLGSPATKRQTLSLPNDIDGKVFMELPDDIRASIISDLSLHRVVGQKHPNRFWKKNRTKNRIDNYFSK